MISVTWNDEFELPDCSYSISDEKIVEMLRNYNYKTGNLLDYLYHQKYYKLIGKDLSRQKKYEYSSTDWFCREIRRR